MPSPYIHAALAQERHQEFLARAETDRPGPAGTLAPAAGWRRLRPQIAAALAPSLATARPEPPVRTPAAARGDGPAGSTPRRVHGADPPGPQP
jgi:hypothetical protein